MTTMLTTSGLRRVTPLFVVLALVTCHHFTEAITKTEAQVQCSANCLQTYRNKVSPRDNQNRSLRTAIRQRYVRSIRCVSNIAAKLFYLL